MFVNPSQILEQRLFIISCSCLPLYGHRLTALRSVLTIQVVDHMGTFPPCQSRHGSSAFSSADWARYNILSDGFERWQRKSLKPSLSHVWRCVSYTEIDWGTLISRTGRVLQESRTTCAFIPPQGQNCNGWWRRSSLSSPSSPSVQFLSAEVHEKSLRCMWQLYLVNWNWTY